MPAGARRDPASLRAQRRRDETEPHLIARGTKIATVFAKHGLKELFGRPDEEGAVGRRAPGQAPARGAGGARARRSRSSGRSCRRAPTCCRPSSSRSSRRCRTTCRRSPRSRSSRVMEQELGVPWEDVFEHRAASRSPPARSPRCTGRRSRTARRSSSRSSGPTRASRSSRTSRCWRCSPRRSGDRPGLKQVIDMEAVFEHLSDSLHRELDFRQEADNMRRMREVIAPFSRLARARRARRLLDVAPAGDARRGRRSDRQRARGHRAQGGRAPAARVLLQADHGRRLLPRRPAPREPDVAARGGPALLPGPRDGRRGRRRDARAADAAADGVLAGGRRLPHRRHADAGGRDRSQRPRRRRVPARRSAS